MKHLIRLKIEKLSEQGQEYFLATSEDVRGLLAEGDTLEEVIDIAQDIAQKLIEMDGQQLAESSGLAHLPEIFEYPILVEV